MFRTFAVIALICATSCSDWPDVDTPELSGSSADWPELVPISELPTDVASNTNSENDANDSLSARAAALRARAAILRRPVPDSDAFEQMRGRLAR